MNTVRSTTARRLAAVGIALSLSALGACGAKSEKVADPAGGAGATTTNTSAEAPAPAGGEAASTPTDGVTVNGSGVSASGVTVDGNGVKAPGVSVSGGGVSAPGVTVDGNGVKAPGVSVDGNGVKAPGVSVNGNGVTVGGGSTPAAKPAAPKSLDAYSAVDAMRNLDLPGGGASSGRITLRGAVNADEQLTQVVCQRAASDARIVTGLLLDGTKFSAAVSPSGSATLGVRKANRIWSGEWGVGAGDPTPSTDTQIIIKDMVIAAEKPSGATGVVTMTLNASC